MKRRRRQFFSAKWAILSLLVALLSSVTAVPVRAVVVMDDFSADANYAFGAVGGIWTGSENMLNLNGGLLNANLSNPGVLTVEDNGTFDADADPMNGISGMGWEGGRSTSPFLFTNVPAGQDFTATVKISSQTSGNWSAAGIIARAANSPTPPGTGANHADENFVTAYSFRTDAANANEGNTLNKRIENGAQVNDNNIAVTPGTEALPLHVRLERVGGGTAYRTWVSTDGGSTYQFQSRVVPTAGNPLGDPAVPLQVGLSYMNFGTLAGTAQFDDFVLDTHNPLPAPGAPSISASQTAFTVPRGTEIEQLITNATSAQGPLSWVRTPNLPGTDAMLPGAQGGPPSALVPATPENGSYFRWDTTGVANGIYMVAITATNDWGQASNTIDLRITIIPEPATLALGAMVAVTIVGFIRRRR
jgi:hypothetical protein